MASSLVCFDQMRLGFNVSMRNIVLFGGKSHQALAKEIAQRLGIRLGEVVLDKFANKETRVEIRQSVRDLDVFILQSGCGAVNDHLMELLIMVDGCKKASARRIVAVIPCFPYARQPDVPYVDYNEFMALPGTLVANMLQAAGVDHVITLDLHHSQFQGFFDIPVDNLFAQPLMLKHITDEVGDYKKAVIVSPDAGGAKRASVIADRLGMEFALIHKGRKKANEALELMLVGDVMNKVAILIDDIVDTAATLLQAVKILVENGAKEVLALITHGIFSGHALDLINQSDINMIVVSNSVPQDEHVKLSKKITTFNVGSIFAEAIRRIHNGESVSFLFSHIPHA